VALGMEAPRVNSVARQVPLLSSRGSIDSDYEAFCGTPVTTLG
jgi:hypothetical protein